MDLSWRCRFQSLLLGNPNDGSHDAWCQIKGSSTPAHDKFPRPEYINPTPSLDSNYLIILSEKNSIARPIQAEIKILILAFHSTRASSCSVQSSLWGVGPLQGRTVASGELLKEEVEKLTSLAAPLFFFSPSAIARLLFLPDFVFSDLFGAAIGCMLSTRIE